MTKSPTLAEFAAAAQRPSPCVVCALPPNVLAEVDEKLLEKHRTNRGLSRPLIRSWLKVLGFAVSDHQMDEHALEHVEGW